MQLHAILLSMIESDVLRDILMVGIIAVESFAVIKNAQTEFTFHSPLQASHFIQIFIDMLLSNVFASCVPNGNPDEDFQIGIFISMEP